MEMYIRFRLSVFIFQEDTQKYCFNQSQFTFTLSKSETKETKETKESRVAAS